MRGFPHGLSWSLAFAASLTIVRLAPATTLDLSWNACTPVVTNKVPTGSPPSPVVLVVRATGQSAPHTGFEFRVDFMDIDGSIPDAWRFDPYGCPGETFFSLQTDPPTPLCPAFQGTGATGVGGMTFFDNDSGFGPPWRFALVVSRRYGATEAPPPGALRSLARVVFDHTYSVAGPGTPGLTCGGFERNLCLTVHPGSARWYDASGAPTSFQSGQSWLTFHDECMPVPVAPSTWGAIKSTYRR